MAKPNRAIPELPPFLLELMGVKSQEELRKELITLGEQQLREMAELGIGRLVDFVRSKLGEAMGDPPMVSPGEAELLTSYDLLGVSPTDSMDDITQAFRQRVFQTDPNPRPGNDGAGSSEQLRLVVEAMQKIRQARSSQ